MSRGGQEKRANIGTESGRKVLQEKHNVKHLEMPVKMRLKRRNQNNKIVVCLEIKISLEVETRLL